MSQTETVLKAPRIVQGGAMKMFGITRRYETPDKSGIMAQWGEFGPHIHAVPNQTGNASYGVMSNFGPRHEFDYMCAVAVTERPDYPGAFELLGIAPQTYAIFEHIEHISSIEKTMNAIWPRGLKENGLTGINAPAFERYDERYQPATGLGGLEIWVPIKAK